MPDRIVRDELLTSERYWSVSIQAQQFYVHLLLVADDAARFSGKNFTLRASCFPGRPLEAQEMERMLAELVDVDLVRVYAVRGERYVFVPRFRNRRRYMGASKYPDPPNEINDLPSKKADSSQPTVNPKSGGVGVGVGEGLGLERGRRGEEPAPTVLSGKAPRKRVSKPAPSASVWSAYSEAYASKYGVAPVRNAKVNAHIAQLVGRLGEDEAAGVARFYLSNRNGLYVSSKHCTDLMLRDAEKLRTEWVTGNVTHQRDANEEDRLSATGAMWDRIGDKLKAKGIE